MARLSLREFWSEIRRRHVMRVAAYYVAGAWIVAQASSLLLDAFDAAHYTRYVIAALGVGLPVALVLAWVFDVTPHGIERTLGRTPPLPEPSAPKHPLPPPASDAPPATTVDAATAPQAPERSIAVLPFANLSREPGDEYFSDGLAEEIRNQLARMPGLRVAARTSSFAFKGRNEDVREIGRRLSVATLLEGGVRRQADTVRIDVQLVGTGDGFHIWSQSFERQLTDIFRLQSEVAAAVSAAVGERHAIPSRVPPRPGTQSFDAYNAYLLGRHHFHKRTIASLERAVECFEKAIAIDPGFALAHSGIADATMLLSMNHYGNLPLKDAIARAETAVQKALELEPELAEAHASLGFVRLHQGDCAAAERALRRSLELNPGYTVAYVWFGLVHIAQRRYEDATAANREAFRRDPLSPIVNCNVGIDALRFGDLDGAQARFAAAMEIDPEFLVPYSGMSRLEVRRGRPREALRWMEQALERAPTRAFFNAGRGALLLQLGDLEGASASIAKARAVAGREFLDSELEVALFIAKGDREALTRVAQDDSAPSSNRERAQALIALGDFDGARARYERESLDEARCIDETLSIGGDWFWRLPHFVNRAHLRLRTGDESGRADLEQYLREVERLRSTGIWNPDVSYGAATAQALLGRREQAAEQLAEGMRSGWHQAWWARVDWNVADLAGDARWLEILRRATERLE
jgi:TolB-like protein/Tfp pilus assembly protein PilF